MLTNFKIQANAIDNSLEVHSDDIHYWLNKAQEDFVKAFFAKFDKDIPSREELKPIYLKNVAASVTYPQIPAPDGVVADRVSIPANLMYLVNVLPTLTYVADPSHWEDNAGSRAVVGGESSSTKKVDTVQPQADDLYRMLQDPFWGPNYDRVLIDIHETYIDIYTNQRSFISSVILNYIKVPAEIKFIADGNGGNQDSELPSYTHDDIVTSAVEMFLQSKGINQT